VLGLTVVLVAAGLVMLYSASAVMAQAQGLPPHYYLLRQMSGALMGLVAVAGRLSWTTAGSGSWPGRWWDW
jgi:cell division protein FtsW